MKQGNQVVRGDSEPIGVLEGELSAPTLLLHLASGERVPIARDALRPRPDGSWLLVGRPELLGRPRAEAPVVASMTVPVQAEPAPVTGANLTAERIGNAAEEAVIPVVEEQLVIEKVEREQGRLRVRVVPSERREEVAVPVTSEQVEVRRVEIGQLVDAPPPVREEGDTLIVPVLEEVLVVQKRLMLREEIHIVRHSITREERHEVTLRSERVEITRVNQEQTRNGK